VITILLVAPDPDRVADLGAQDSSREILLASDAEEAVEKLARNRRIDAVLLLPFPAAAAAVAAIREELSPPPPLFAPASAGLEGVQPLRTDEPEALLAAVAAALEGPADR
jgi:hypothetical protein